MELWLCYCDYEYEGDVHIAVVDSEAKANKLKEDWCESRVRRGNEFIIDKIELNKVYHDGGLL